MRLTDSMRALMIPFFNNKKKTEKPEKSQQGGKKSALNSLQGDMNVLDNARMNKLGGGKSGSKTFEDLFDWNSSCSDTIPQ